MEPQSETFAYSHATASVPQSVDKTPFSADTSSISAQGAPPSPVPVTPVATASNLCSQSASESSALPVVASSVTINADEVQKTVNPVASVPTSAEVTATVGDTITAPMYCILYIYYFFRKFLS